MARRTCDARCRRVDAILRSTPGQRAARVVGRAVLKRTLTAELDEVRAAAAKGSGAADADEILARAVGAACRATGGLSPVINATGVILHTNLGRAPLAPGAVEAVRRAAGGYTDLEVDRSTGARGSRGGPRRAAAGRAHRRRRTRSS